MPILEHRCPLAADIHDLGATASVSMISPVVTDAFVPPATVPFVSVVLW